MLDHNEFVVQTGARFPLSVMWAALGSDFDLEHEPSRAVARTWLDTFDWRLFRAGLTLEHAGTSRGGELVLSAVTGRQLARSGTIVTWPARLTDTIPAAIGEAVAAVVGGRALLPVAQTTATVTGVRLLNRDEKTVVRAVLEEGEVVAPSPARLACRLSIRAVRGYDRQALLAQRILLATPGIAPVATSDLEQALNAVGRRPGEYAGVVEVALSASTPASSAMASVLRHVLDALEANVDGVVQDLDTEFLHDLRIAVGRTSAGLALAGDALPSGLAARFAGEFTWLSQLSSPVRDLDAGLEGLDVALFELDPNIADALKPVYRHLEGRRRNAWPDLAAGLRSPRFTTLVHDWRAALAAVPSQRVEGERTVAQLATARITRGYHRILQPGKAITPASPAEDLHELRKRAQELRYLLECFASLHPPAAHRAMINELNLVQECLGRFQDSQVQREAITSLAAQVAGELPDPGPTVRAIEQLARRLDVQQLQARGEFAGRIKQFAGPQIVGLLMALTDPPT